MDYIFLDTGHVDILLTEDKYRDYLDSRKDIICLISPLEGIILTRKDSLEAEIEFLDEFQKENFEYFSGLVIKGENSYSRIIADLQNLDFKISSQNIILFKNYLSGRILYLKFDSSK